MTRLLRTSGTVCLRVDVFYSFIYNRADSCSWALRRKSVDLFADDRDPQHGSEPVKR